MYSFFTYLKWILALILIKLVNLFANNVLKDVNAEYFDCIKDKEKSEDLKDFDLLKTHRKNVLQDEISNFHIPKKSP